MKRTCAISRRESCRVPSGITARLHDVEFNPRESSNVATERSPRAGYIFRKEFTGMTPQLRKSPSALTDDTKNVAQASRLRFAYVTSETVAPPRIPRPRLPPSLFLRYEGHRSSHRH